MDRCKRYVTPLNPKLVKQAQAIPPYSYEEAMETNRNFGAKSFCTLPTIQPCYQKEFQCPIKKSFDDENEGTTH